MEDDPATVRKKSRDFYWYSPVLKRALDHVSGDLVVPPRTEAEVRRVIAAAFDADVPVTPRGLDPPMTMYGCYAVPGATTLRGAAFAR